MASSHCVRKWEQHNGEKLQDFHRQAQGQYCLFSIYQLFSNTPLNGRAGLIAILASDFPVQDSPG